MSGHSLSDASRDCGRRSSFDATRELQRQQSFTNDLNARLRSENDIDQHVLPPPAEPGAKHVSFDAASTAKEHNTPNRTPSDPPNVLPLDPKGFDPEKGEISSSRSPPYFLPPSPRWKLYLRQEVAHNHFLEAQLLALTLATGITDAVTAAHFRCFVSKQTGNTVYLALWAVRHPSTAGLERNIGVSMGCFVLGSIAFGHIGHAVRQRRRAWLLANNAAQCACVYAAVALALADPPAASGARALLVVALLSFAAGGQISLALCVKLPELNTTMITGALIQLATDRRVFALRNAPRNRRLAFFAALLAGAFVGSAATARVGPALGLLLNAVVKTVVCVSFLFNHGLLVGPGEPLDEGSGTATPFERILWGD